MQTLLNRLLELSPPPWGTVMVIGARPGVHLHLLRPLRARRLILTQAQPELATKLAKQVDASRGEQLLATAVAEPDAGQTTVKLRVCSLPKYNAFGTFEPLANLLPNLEAVDEVSVAAVSLKRVLEDVPFDPESANLLVMDAPGQLSGVIPEIATLVQFSYLIVVAGETPLFGDGLEISHVVDRLQQAGFDELADDPCAIYPLSARALRGNTLKIELYREREERARIQAKLDRSEEEVATVIASRSQLYERIDELETLLASKTEAEREARTQYQGLSLQVESIESKNVELAKSLGALGAERDRCSESATERLSQIEALKLQVAKLEGDLSRSHDSAALAVRLQTLRENDLENLRERYGDLYDAHEAQRALLTKLSDRLVAANQYFQKLAGSEGLNLRSEAGEQEVATPSIEDDRYSTPDSADMFEVRKKQSLEARPRGTGDES